MACCSAEQLQELVDGELGIDMVVLIFEATFKKKILIING